MKISKNEYMNLPMWRNSRGDVLARQWVSRSAHIYDTWIFAKNYLVFL